VATIIPMIWTSMSGNKKAIFAATGLRPVNEMTKDLIIPQRAD
jgi:hypothetical protein